MIISDLPHSIAEYGIIRAYKKLSRNVNCREHDRSVKEISMRSISRTPSIYQIRHIESGRVYVGSAVNPQKRCRGHVHALRHNVHASRHLQNAWNKYGADAFVFEIIEPVLFVEDLIPREQYWMDRLHAADHQHGFNIAPIAGSALGVKMSPEVRAKLSAGRRARLASPEERSKLSARARKRYEDPLERARLSERARKRCEDPLVRARLLENQRITQSPEVRARAEAGMREAYADPAARKKASERALARYGKDQSLQQRLSKIAQSQWDDPIYREKVMAAHERKRQERAMNAAPVTKSKSDATCEKLRVAHLARAEETRRRVASLTNEQVIEIRVLIRQGERTQQGIADQYGVSASTISLIKTGRTYLYVDDPPDCDD